MLSTAAAVDIHAESDGTADSAVLSTVATADIHAESDGTADSAVLMDAAAVDTSDSVVLITAVAVNIHAEPAAPQIRRCSWTLRRRRPHPGLKSRATDGRPSGTEADSAPSPLPC